MTSARPLRCAKVRPARARVLLLGLIIVALVCTALGTWQVQRRAWKHALVARVTQRVQAAPVPAPPRLPNGLPAPSVSADEYRHVSVHGRFLPEHSTLVQAVTVYGGGYWLMTPLSRDDGSTVLINRGFVLQAPAAPAPAELITVTGLLRLSEPKGGFLRRNDPADARWYSRDVEAIAAAQRLGAVAPYFIDAEAAPAAGYPASARRGAAPIAGLTVVQFPDNHLVYALTWYALALMAAGAVIRLCRTCADREARPSPPG